MMRGRRVTALLLQLPKSDSDRLRHISKMLVRPQFNISLKVDIISTGKFKYDKEGSTYLSGP
jgi:hypothetical protein